MEIPDINMIRGFESGMQCLQNPSLISRLDIVPEIYSFWKWGALFFAIFATFSSIIRKVMLIFIRFHTLKPSSHQVEEIIQSTEDAEISSASSEDEYELAKEDDCPKTSFVGHGEGGDEGDLLVKGVSGYLQRGGGGAWSDFAPGESVVKLWDSLGCRLYFDEDLLGCGGQSVVSTWDGDEIDFPGEAWEWNVPAAALDAAVGLTAARNRKGGGVIFGGYDARMPRHVPALYGEWRLPEAEKVGGVGVGRAGKVCVRDDVGRVVAVGDVRNVKRPLDII